MWRMVRKHIVDAYYRFQFFIEHCVGALTATLREVVGQGSAYFHLNDPNHCRHAEAGESCDGCLGIDRVAAGRELFGSDASENDFAIHQNAIAIENNQSHMVLFRRNISRAASNAPPTMSAQAPATIPVASP